VSAGKRDWELWKNEHIDLEALTTSWETGDTWVVEAISRRLPSVTGSVLDAGCGAGRFSTLFKPEVYLGIDNSPEMLELARRRHPQYTFKEADIYNLRFSNMEFELVLSHSVLKHLPLIEPPIRELWRVAAQYCAVTLLLGPMEDNTQRWKGFLNHVLAYTDFFACITTLNPRPVRVDLHYFDVAHGWFVILYKEVGE
jgi:ubiquinone/menaquinone biosynthesis C-methylase UbiE